MNFIRRYYQKMLVKSTWRGQGKCWWKYYYTLGMYYGWKWFFTPKRTKVRIIEKTFYK